MHTPCLVSKGYCCFWSLNKIQWGIVSTGSSSRRQETVYDSNRLIRWCDDGMKMVEKAVSEYGFFPYYIEQISSRLFRVNDGRRDYALKQSSLTEETIYLWENVYHQAHTLQLTNILPVYLTGDARLYAWIDGEYYYMTPWMRSHSSNNRQEIKDVFHTIGEIHAKTKQTQNIDAASVEKSFRDYQSRCREWQDLLLDFVKRFEQNRFMSPFELQVCTHYHILVNVLMELEAQIERFMDAWEESSTWNYCLCHGNLQSEHIIYHDLPYIINWEKARYDNPVIDLAIYLKTQVRYYDQSPAELAELFPAYSHRNSLDEKEWHLLLIYLLNPAHYIRLVEMYTSAQSGQSIITQQKMLQHVFRQLQLGLDWTHRLKSDLAPDFKVSEES
ncbi:spore coat protein YsxE [Lentibacillus lipolyticus]|nr:spore coat protein YsxE [Lentibacillus lipolyticus]